MDYLGELAKAIRHVHGCEATHVEAVRVTEMFRGQIAWDGAVEVFDVTGHAKAKRCYAWGVPNEANRERLDVTAVLEIPPVDSPQTAVKAAIVHASKLSG